MMDANLLFLGKETSPEVAESRGSDKLCHFATEEWSRLTRGPWDRGLADEV